ncbi:MAG: hypothetical protein Tsb009_23320 [Planctomycetaceae bacterium]
MTSAPETLHGVLPVFQTPYHDDESIDFDTLDAELDWIFRCGAHGVVMAMVSEVLRLSIEEREQLAAHVCETVAHRGFVVVSTGAESSHIAERLTRHASDVGASAVMAIPPVATSLGEDELFRYYERILHATELPVIVQDASGYVGRPMSIELQARILQEFGPRVKFKPEAVPLGPRLSELRDATNGQAEVFEGSGGIALVDSYRRGVVGTMPGGDVVDAVVALWNALEAGDDERAYRISLPLSSLIAVQTNLDAFLAVEKHILVKRGIFKNRRVRGPVGFHLDRETREEVDRLLDRLLAAVNED